MMIDMSWEKLRRISFRARKRRQITHRQHKWAHISRSWIDDEEEDNFAVVANRSKFSFGEAMKISRGDVKNNAPRWNMIAFHLAGNSWNSSRSLMIRESIERHIVGSEIVSRWQVPGENPKVLSSVNHEKFFVSLARKYSKLRKRQTSAEAWKGTSRSSGFTARLCSVN